MEERLERLAHRLAHLLSLPHRGTITIIVGKERPPMLNGMHRLRKSSLIPISLVPIQGQPIMGTYRQRRCSYARKLHRISKNDLRDEYARRLLSSYTFQLHYSFPHLEPHRLLNLRNISHHRPILVRLLRPRIHQPPNIRTRTRRI